MRHPSWVKMRAVTELVCELSVLISVKSDSHTLMVVSYEPEAILPLSETASEQTPLECPPFFSSSVFNSLKSFPSQTLILLSLDPDIISPLILMATARTED